MGAVNECLKQRDQLRGRVSRRRRDRAIAGREESRLFGRRHRSPEPQLARVIAVEIRHGHVAVLRDLKHRGPGITETPKMRPRDRGNRRPRVAAG